MWWRRLLQRFGAAPAGEGDTVTRARAEQLEREQQEAADQAERQARLDSAQGRLDALQWRVQVQQRDMRRRHP